MADRKISDLTALTTPASGDFLPIVDISEAAAASKNKKITYSDFLNNIPTGTITSTMILDGTILNADINASAAIVDTKLATIATGGKVSNSATTATDANTASAIVARDASGNFSAGTITAALTGAASSNVLKAGDTMTGALVVPLASAATPSLTFTGDLNTGIYSPGADQLAVATNGTTRITVDSSGNLIKTGGVIKGERGTAAAPAYSFTDDTDTGIFNISNVDLGFSVGGTERARIDSSGRLGIGTSSPRVNVHILGTASNAPTLGVASGSLIVGPGDRDYGLAMGTAAAGYSWIQSQNFVSAGAAYSLLLQPSGGNVGIGTASPALKFVVSNDGNEGFEVLPGQSSDLNSFYHYNRGSSAYIDYRVFANTHQFYKQGSSEAARIDSSGRLLVGTSTANANGGILQLTSGITFPATAVAASDANTLDDYEEGTWTPTQGTGTTAVGAFTSVGSYVKVGRILSYAGYMFGATSIAFNPAGGTLVEGMPFPVATGFNSSGTAQNSTVSVFIIATAGGVAIYGQSAISATAVIYFAGTCLTN
jgi:hypothetical protein